MKELDDTDALFVIESGELEVFIEMEGNEFVIDKLTSGAVLNHRSVFTED